MNGQRAEAGALSTDQQKRLHIRAKSYCIQLR
jgi:hypothetical protein